MLTTGHSKSPVNLSEISNSNPVLNLDVSPPDMYEQFLMYLNKLNNNDKLQNSYEKFVIF